MSAHAVGVTYRWVAILMTVVAALGWGVLFVLSPSAERRAMSYKDCENP